MRTAGYEDRKILLVLEKTTVRDQPLLLQQAVTYTKTNGSIKKIKDINNGKHTISR